MQCVDLGDLLSAYADGQTLPAQTAAVEAHLAGCAYCRRVLARFQQTGSLLALTRGEVWTPPDLRLRVRLACQQGEQTRHGPAWHLAMAAGVAALGLSGALFFGQALAPSLVATPTVPHMMPMTGLQTSAQPRGLTHPASVADCPRQSILGIAQCLGVSRAIVPVILLEERDEHVVAMRLNQTNVTTQESVSATTSGTADLKGGGARGLNNGNHRGMQAI
jgi:hypothetical protein